MENMKEESCEGGDGVGGSAQDIVYLHQHMGIQGCIRQLPW